MQDYRWTINGRPFEPARLDEEGLQLREGERVRLRFENRSPMFHPMHLHGHTFQVRGTSDPGPRKDTVIVRPGETIRSEEHTSELQSLMRISYAVFCLTKKKT